MKYPFLFPVLTSMCGRFTLFASAHDLEQHYDASFEETLYTPSYNIAPTVYHPILANDDSRLFQITKWGLKPSWFKKASGLINVRSDTIQTKPFFRKIFETKRCLIPASGFYEWKKESNGKKTPYYVTLENAEVFSFGGVWHEMKNEDGSTEKTFAIITTDANDFMSPVHNRMPVIIPKEYEKDWIHDDSDIHKLADLMYPFDSSVMKMQQVSTQINNPRNNSAELINSV